MEQQEQPILNASFWDQRWQSGNTGWDVGYATPPIAEFMAQFSNKNARILIPGCGNAYEAEFMLAGGFKDITLLDISETAVARLKAKFKDHLEIKVMQGDFFQHQGQYDLVVEQTFFCAQDPKRRKAYVQKMHELLTPGGRLVGVMFRKDFGWNHPPFGGSKAEYQKLFGPYFEILKMEDCYNSIAPRAGSELFVNLLKK